MHDLYKYAFFITMQLHTILNLLFSWAPANMAIYSDLNRWISFMWKDVERDKMTRPISASRLRYMLLIKDCENHGARPLAASCDRNSGFNMTLAAIESH